MRPSYRLGRYDALSALVKVGVPSAAVAGIAAATPTTNIVKAGAKRIGRSLSSSGWLAVVAGASTTVRSSVCNSADKARGSGDYHQVGGNAQEK
jgi:hypothetical protein